jgi:hypothetical protein
MKVGSKWFYMSRSGLRSLPDNLEVTGRVAIGDVQGYELTGDLGVVHLGWRGGRLVSDEMSGSRFTPPLPILAPAERKADWRGWVYTADRREPAKAFVTHSVIQLDQPGRSVKTVLSQVDMKLADRSVQLLTWFEPGVGIVRQVQRTNQRSDLMIEFLGR